MQHNTSEQDTTARDPERALTSKQAGEILGVSIITLCQWRLRGEGPRWFSIGRRNIRYRYADVIAWRDARVYARDPRKVKP